MFCLYTRKDIRRYYVHAIELMRAKESLAHDEKTEKSFSNDYVGQFGTISG